MEQKSIKKISWMTMGFPFRNQAFKNYIAAGLCAAILLCVVWIVGSLFIAFSSLSPYQEALNLGKNARKGYVDALLLPVSLLQAEDFDVGRLSGIDGGEEWIRLRMPESFDHDLFRRELAQMQKNARYADHHAWEFDSTSSGDLHDLPERPAGYPRPSEITPAWWSPDNSPDDINGVYLGKQIVREKSSGVSSAISSDVAEGLCVLYSPSARSVWIWSWTRQHVSLDID